MGAFRFKDRRSSRVNASLQILYRIFYMQIIKMRTHILHTIAVIYNNNHMNCYKLPAPRLRHCAHAETHGKVRLGADHPNGNLERENT